METNYNATSQSVGSHTHSQVGSFREAIEDAREQIEIQCFDKSDLPQVEEIALIIAEVNMLHPDMLIQIGGNKLTVQMVKEIYARLTKEHVDMVLRSFRTVNYEIKHIKTYLRTALYNSVFEYEGKNDIEFQKAGQ